MTQVYIRIHIYNEIYIEKKKEEISDDFWLRSDIAIQKKTILPKRGIP